MKKTTDLTFAKQRVTGTFTRSHKRSFLTKLAVKRVLSRNIKEKLHEKKSSGVPHVLQNTSVQSPWQVESALTLL